MLKKRSLNSNLNSYLTKLGHRDLTCVSDAGLPIPQCVERIDLSIERGLPTLFQVLEIIAEEAVFEKIFIAGELKTEKTYQEFDKRIHEIFGEIDIEFISHGNLKEINQNKSRAVIRTGDKRPYHNVILQSGVKL